MIVVGLTGSIGMGKTTTAGMFADEGVPVAAADAIVHDLYRGRAAGPVERAFPGTVRDGVVDRDALSRAVIGNADATARLEKIVHPMVREEEDRFVQARRAAGAPFVVLDIPLLFETNRDREMDRIVVASCAPAVQRDRVLARPGMTAEKFEAILARQTPDSQKRASADYVVETGDGLAAAAERVAAIVADLRRISRRAQAGAGQDER